jgi:hypothetical protein
MIGSQGRTCELRAGVAQDRSLKSTPGRYPTHGSARDDSRPCTGAVGQLRSKRGVCWRWRWDWNGLFNLAVVQTHPRAPAGATGIVQTGGGLGSFLGPLLFALILTRWPYGIGWAAAVGEATAAGVVLSFGGALVHREMGSSSFKAAGTPRTSM